MKSVHKKRHVVIRDHHFESKIFAYRAYISFGLMLFAFGMLLANVYKLQIVDHETYQTKANSNRIRVLPLAPARGLIYDRNGLLLADNKPVYQFNIVPEQVPNLSIALTRLQSLIPSITDDDMSSFKEQVKRSRSFQPIPLKTHLTQKEIALFSAQQYRFPGIRIDAVLKRFYPFRDLYTHSVGYVAKINDSDINDLKARDVLGDYKATYDIGKLGVERYYESRLHGISGYQEVEVNSSGRIVRVLKSVPPEAGSNIWLTFDSRLQAKVKELMGKRRGAVIVLDAKTADILAMVSNPSYDPNLFVNGISRAAYKALDSDPYFPFVNRTTYGLYPPASTVKPFMLVSGLTEGVLTPSTTRNDNGSWLPPNAKENARAFKDWNRWGHGRVDSLKAIEESVDTFFYQLVYDLGIDRTHKWMSKFGFGKETGIDLDSREELLGVMPTREWKLKNKKKPWYIGDTISVGIGQGYWSATPMQIAKAFFTLVNDGRSIVPHMTAYEQKNGIKSPFLYTVNDELTQIPKPYWDLAKKGMYLVTNGPSGTAKRVFANTCYLAAGKSGTAQVYSVKKDEVYDEKKLSKNLYTHALFVSFVPYDDPKYIVVAVLDHGGGGGAVSGKLVRSIFDYLFNNCSDEKKLDF